MLRLAGEVMRPVRFASPLDFEHTRTAVNEALLYSGYKVLNDGKVARTIAATTVTEAQQRADDLRAELNRRDVHPDVLHFAEPS